MLRLSISPTLAEATAQASARPRISTARRSRAASVSCLESASPSMGRAGSSITAAANTLPARGPRPASSTPHSSAEVGSVGGGRRMRREDRFQGLDDTRIMTFRERLVKPREALAQLFARRLVVEPVAERLRQVGGRGVLLQDLRHDE